MGKVHGSLARAGKVRGQTPKVAKQDKKKKPHGHAHNHNRMQYNRRFLTAVVGPNSSEKCGTLLVCRICITTFFLIFDL
jgi:small subunit ribosomal protein S30e